LTAFILLPPVFKKIEISKVLPTKKVPEEGERYKEAPSALIPFGNQTKTNKKLNKTNNLIFIRFIILLSPF
jgi:hypothetical protein